MKKYQSPMKEVNHNIGNLYEVSLQSNLRLTESVENLKITVKNLVSSESRVKDIILAQQMVEQRYKLKASSQ